MSGNVDIVEKKHFLLFVFFDTRIRNPQYKAESNKKVFSILVSGTLSLFKNY
jgi:hypothetical protein